MMLLAFRLYLPKNLFLELCGIVCEQSVSNSFSTIVLLC